MQSTQESLKRIGELAGSGTHAAALRRTLEQAAQLFVAAAQEANEAAEAAAQAKS